MAQTMRAIALGGLVAAIASPASAQSLSEAHVGLMAHNIQVIDGKNAGKEDGPSLEAELTFASPSALKGIGAPRPSVLASLNIAGETSFVGVGLTWTVPLGARWSLDPGLGYVIHDGEIDNAFPPGSAQANASGAKTLFLGSRDLFRVSLGLSRDLGPRASVQAFYSHLSHGQILGSGRNQGLDQAGVRLGWKLGE